MEDLAAESAFRKERIAKLLSKLSEAPPARAPAAPLPSAAPTSSSGPRPPPSARSGFRGNGTSGGTSGGTSRGNNNSSSSGGGSGNASSSSSSSGNGGSGRRQGAIRSEDPVSAQSPPAAQRPPQKTAEQSAKDRVSSALVQQGIEERAKIRREKAAELQRAAESRVKKRSQDEKRRHDDRAYLEEQQLLSYQLEYKRQAVLKKEGAQQRDLDEMHMQTLRARAKTFYEQQLLVRCGLAPLLQLVDAARTNWIKAMDFYDDSLVQAAWVALYGFCATQKRDRLRRDHRQAALATSHYKRTLIYSNFRRWALHRRMLKAKATAVTGHFSRFTVGRRAWRAWRIALEQSRRQQAMRFKLARPIGDRCTMRHCFIKWTAFMAERRLEAEVEARSDFTWSKVQNWLKE